MAASSTRRIGAGQVEQQRVGGGVLHRLQVLAHGVAADRDAVLDDQLGLAEVEGVALDGVGVVGQADAQILVELGDDRRGQRALEDRARPSSRRCGGPGGDRWRYQVSW